jgi:hydrogenase maturation protease
MANCTLPKSRMTIRTATRVIFDSRRMESTCRKSGTIGRGEERAAVANPTVLVAGLGNIFLGDDGFGVEVARKLAQREFPEEVRVVDFGIRSFDLAFALVDGTDLTILVDATQRGGPPGTLYTIDPGPDNFERMEPQCVDGQRLDPVQVLRMARRMEGRLGRIVLIGCEPATFGSEEDGQLGLSPPVAAAVDRAVELVQSLIDRSRIDKTPAAGTA